MARPTKKVAALGEAVDVASYRRSFAAALRSGSAARRNGPRTSGPWARGVHEEIARIGELVPAGHADAVIVITEYALGRVDVTMGRVDDSSGWFAQIVADLERLHHDASEVVRPDPVALARRLFALEIDTDWDILIDSPKRYADLLGDAGLAEMRRLATERWEQLPPADPGRFGRSSRPFHLTRMMETLAEVAGDVDGRVAVMAQDLSYPYDYVRIAEVLAEAGRVDDALAWAERGIAGFEDRAAAREAAVASRPTPNNRYRARLPRPSTYEDLIAVLAWDGQLDDAWATAIEHGATTHLWLHLGAAREADHPLDAASAYARQVEELVERKQTHSYEQAVERIAHIRSLHDRAGDLDGFDAYLADVRPRHRQKTKLIRLLDDAGFCDPSGPSLRNSHPNST